MAFLRKGEHAAMVERGRLVEAVKALYPRPRRTAPNHEWAAWCNRQNAIHEYDDDHLRRVLRDHTDLAHPA